jgi:hypothetical protein
MREYKEEHCWQYDIRLNNKKDDVLLLKNNNIDINEIKNLKVSDFQLQYEEKKAVYAEAKKFIETHEWLGRMSLYSTHIFTARYKGILAGVVIMDLPTAFSKLLGDNTRTIERLISRGACISWSPKNLASALIMFSINWMVKNTRFRVFTAYSDPEAKELGTIYQACNFYYLGQKSGAKYHYKNHKGNWVSDRYFRTRSTYKWIAKKLLNIEWNPEWQNGNKIFFEKMPENYAMLIKNKSKELIDTAEKRKLFPKHKYVYILGSNKKETKQLRDKFLSMNKIYTYPKKRGI